MRVRTVEKRIARRAVNNIVVNNLAVSLHFEERLKRWEHPYRRFRPNANKSQQENAGFSDRPEINAALRKTHDDLQRVACTHLPVLARKRRVLEVGCGPGLYLRDFDVNTFDISGIDLNPGMCNIARNTLPHAQIIEGDFMATVMHGTFDLLYVVSVLQYIGRTQVERFFEKVANHLEPGGILFLNYQHAISPWDLLFPDLTYIQYSSQLVERLASRNLTILEHSHAFDDRQVGLYDRHPYRSQNPGIAKTFLNSSLLVARKDHV